MHTTEHALDDTLKYAWQNIAEETILPDDFIEVISAPNLINIKLVDLKTIVKQGGIAVLGVGESNTTNRAEEAVQNALRRPLLDADYRGVRGIIVLMTGDEKMTIEEVNRVREIVRKSLGHNVQIVVGATKKETGTLKVVLLMTDVYSPKIPSLLGTIAPTIFNLEPYAEPEKTVSIDLNLYQMEPTL